MGLAVRLQVAFLPRDVPTPAGRVCVVLDVLRASSTLVTLLERGAAPVYVAGTVDAAQALAARLGGAALLCGEVGGLPPPGFDYGNSPTEMAGLALGGRPVVLATSNGTRALAALAAAPAVLVGCFLNAAAVVEGAVALAQALDANLTLVCSGDEQGTLFSLEDALAAGYLADLVLARSGEPEVALDDAARAAWRLWGAYAADVAPAEAAAQGFADSVHGRDLARLGFHADLAYCARADASRAVPRLVVDGEQLVLRDANA